MADCPRHSFAWTLSFAVGGESNPAFSPSRTYMKQMGQGLGLLARSITKSLHVYAHLVSRFTS